MLVRESGRHAAAGCAVEEADLEQVRLNDLFDRIFFFVDRGGDRAKADGAAIKFFDDGFEQLCIHLIEAVAVDFHPVKSVASDMFGNTAVMIDLGKITHSSQQAIDYTWRTAAATGDLMRTLLLDLDVQNARRAVADRLQIVDPIEIKMKDDPKSAS